jgi:hypothetical protein
MHVYATDAKDRRDLPIWGASIAVACTLFLNWALQAWDLSVPWWVDAPSVMGFYGLFSQWFDKYLWRLKVGPLSISDIPDLNGTWVGVIHSTYDGRTEVPDVVLYIRQTWTRIGVELQTENSRSYSTMAAVNTPGSSEAGLKYEYINEPFALSLETMHLHRGNTSLKISPDGRTLEGDYFSGRGRQNVGTMTFHLVSRQVLPRAKAIQSLNQ